MKTPDIMASFVHGSLRRAGWGGAVTATVQTLPLLASPSLSTSDCLRLNLSVYVYVCVCMKVCVCARTFA